MTNLKRTLATATAIAAATLAAAAPAGAQERDPRGFVVDGPYSVQAEPNANGIIAILIGFTPPIGSNKGSFASDGLGASGPAHQNIQNR